MAREGIEPPTRGFSNGPPAWGRREPAVDRRIRSEPARSRSRPGVLRTDLPTEVPTHPTARSPTKGNLMVRRGWTTRSQKRGSSRPDALNAQKRYRRAPALRGFSGGQRRHHKRSLGTAKSVPGMSYADTQGPSEQSLDPYKNRGVSGTIEVLEWGAAGLPLPTARITQSPGIRHNSSTDSVWLLFGTAWSRIPRTGDWMSLYLPADPSVCMGQA